MRFSIPIISLPDDPGRWKPGDLGLHPVRVLLRVEVRHEAADGHASRLVE